MVRLLLIDDNRDILEANRSYFADQGCDAVACSSGEAAVKRLDAERYDCIVLDVMMPGMDGYEVCRAVRERGDTPVIFLSCLDQPDDKVRGLMLGGDAYMVKPYDLRELHAQVLSCVRGRQGAAPAGLDFAVDWERRVVRLNERCAVLSRKELSLLKLLWESPDTPLRKEDLSAALWPGEDADEARLQNMVRNLRRKIEFAESRVGQISSVYGEGYRLDTPKGGRRP